MVYETLRDYVKDEGVKYTVIAKKSGIPVDAVSSIMKGKRKMDVEEYIRICAALRIPPEKFLGEVSN